MRQQVLSEQRLAAAQQRANQEKRSLAAVLLDDESISGSALAQALAEASGLPYLKLDNVEINPEAMQSISPQAVKTYGFVPVDVQDGALVVALANPYDTQAIEAVRFIAQKRGLTTQLKVGEAAAINQLLFKKNEVKADLVSSLLDFGGELAAADIGQEDDQAVQQYAAQAPVSKIVAVIIRHAIEGHASDIHIEPTETDLRIRYRIDGKLHTSLMLPKNIHNSVLSRLKILAHLPIEETGKPLEGRFSSTVDGRSLDFRIAIMPTIFGDKVTVRILDKSGGTITLQNLGMLDQQQEQIEQQLKAPHGLIIVAGPPGAGKSTTLFAALNTLNKSELNIITLEDPIEYEVSGISQTQINQPIGLTYATGLRSLLHQDPDVIMVGEIDDGEVAGLIVHAALAGHLMLSAMHTPDAASAVVRLLKFGLDPYVLAATLRLLIAQRLVAKLCEACRTEVELSSSSRKQISASLRGVPDEYRKLPNQENPKIVWQAAGCTYCHESGLIGRAAIFEIVPVTQRVKDAIVEGPEYDTIADVMRAEGNLSMYQDGLLKSLAGKVLLADVLRTTGNSTR